MLRIPALALLLVSLSLIICTGCATTVTDKREPIEVWEGEWDLITDKQKFPVTLFVYEKTAAANNQELIQGKIKSKFLGRENESCRLTLNLKATLSDNIITGEASGAVNVEGEGYYPANGTFNGTMTKTEGVILFAINFVTSPRVVHVEGDWTLKPVKLDE